MFKHYFEQIENVAIWPIISLSIFFIFFICLLLYVFTVDKAYIKEVSELPMDDSSADSKNQSLL
jgi:cytochrome c oxidase cbb3-type subunit 3